MIENANLRRLENKEHLLEDEMLRCYKQDYYRAMAIKEELTKIRILIRNEKWKLQREGRIW